jgi:hypothetical protein
MTKPVKTPSRTSVPPAPPPDMEKNNVSNTIAAKSATVAPAMIVCPASVSSCPVSLSTETTSPSEVAESATAIKSAELVQPRAVRAAPIRTPRPIVTRYPNPAVRSARPCSRRRSISSPARNSRKARPRTASTRTGRSTSTSPSTEGQDDSRHDLNNHRWQPKPRQKAQQQRRADGNRRHNQQVDEGDLSHHDQLL